MPALEDQLISDLEKIAKRTGHNHPFELILTSDIIQTKDGLLVDIQLEAGHPPKIVIPLIFLARVSIVKKNPILYRDRLERALERLPSVDRTLANLVPKNLALILARDTKKWKKVRNETIHRDIPDSYFDVSYTVTVRERLTGMSQTIVGSDVKEITREAKHRLSRIILNDESMQDFRDLVESLAEPIKIASSPSTIQIASKVVDNQIILDTATESRSY